MYLFVLHLVFSPNKQLTASGIDVTKVVIGEGDGNIVSSSTSTITHEGDTVITKIVTTKVATTEKVC